MRAWGNFFCPLSGGADSSSCYQFTCFPSTKVQILTPEGLRARAATSARSLAALTGSLLHQFTCCASTKVPILTYFCPLSGDADSSSVVAIAGSLLHQFTCFPSTKVQQHMLLAYECDDDGHEGGNDRVDHC